MTGLIAADRLAEARVRAGFRLRSRRAAESGLAPSGGVARALAERHRMPFVDLAETEVRRTRSKSIPSTCSSASARCRTRSRATS